MKSLNQHADNTQFPPQSVLRGTSARGQKTVEAVMAETGKKPVLRLISCLLSVGCLALHGLEDHPSEYSESLESGTRKNQAPGPGETCLTPCNVLVIT